VPAPQAQSTPAEPAPSGSTPGNNSSAAPADASTLTPQQRRERGLAAEKKGEKVPTSSVPADRAAAEVAKLIMRIQLSLNSRGYCNCTVDGKFGQRTQLALKKYQKDNGLTVSGLPDTQTLKQLDVAF